MNTSLRGQTLPSHAGGAFAEKARRKFRDLLELQNMSEKDATIGRLAKLKY